jgi:hypothetical protein
MGFEVPGLVIVALVLCGIVLLFAIGAALFTFLVKVGVIVREARRPVHMDSGDYRLEQGHEVRGEEQHSTNKISR